MNAHERSVLLVAVASSMLIVVGSFGPWIQTVLIDVSGVDTNDGKIVGLVGAGVAGLLGYLYLQRRWIVPIVVLMMLGLALTSYLTVTNWIDIADLADTSSRLENPLFRFRVGWGLQLSTVASIACLLLLAYITANRRLSDSGDRAA